MEERKAINKKFRKELSAGTVALVLLSVLEQGGEPMYGYQIAKLLEVGEGEETLVKGGALYPVLRSLEKSGLLGSSVEPSVSGPPRRYYTITESGRAVLGDWTRLWNQTKAFVDHVLTGGYDD